MLLLGFVAAVGCAVPAEVAEGVGADRPTGGAATSGGNGGGGTASGGKQEESGETGGKAAGDGTGGKAADASGGTESSGGQGVSETGGAAPAGDIDEALYGKLELGYQSSGTTQFVLDLTNSSGRDLDTAGIEIRYWMTPEGAISDAVCECYSVQGAIKTCDDVERTFVEGPPTYLQITFDVPPTWKFWGSTDQVSEIEGLQIAIHRKDYQNDDMTNDYSYQEESGANEKITIYYNGRLVWGVEPEG
ncbi:MAG: hypothetical protein JW940_20310 [Polyangiaceae bacterium]|nr:hypothetical protein [Polyangiaceae bacterium]